MTLASAGSSVMRWSEAGLLVSLAVFLLVVWQIWRRKHRAEHERAARLPLEDDAPQGQRDRDREP